MVRGVIVPLVTPFKADYSLDEEGLFRLIEHVIEGGVEAIFVLGSCGEFPALDFAEKIRLVKLASHYIRGRVQLWAGAGEPTTKLSLSLAWEMLSAGADAVVIISPFYYLHTQEELFVHFSKIAKMLKAPVIVYNNPIMTKHFISPQLFNRLLGEPNIIGFKDSAGDMAIFQEYLSTARNRPDFAVYQGAEPLAGLSLVRGATGVVLGLANVAPRLCVDLYEAAQSEAFSKVWDIHDKLMKLSSIQRKKSWLVGLKTALSLMGLCQSFVSEPFEPLDPAEVKDIVAVLTQLELIS